MFLSRIVVLSRIRWRENSLSEKSLTRLKLSNRFLDEVQASLGRSLGGRDSFSHWRAGKRTEPFGLGKTRTRNWALPSLPYNAVQYLNVTKGLLDGSTHLNLLLRQRVRFYDWTATLLAFVAYLLTAAFSRFSNRTSSNLSSVQRSTNIFCVLHGPFIFIVWSCFYRFVSCAIPCYPVLSRVVDVAGASSSLKTCCSHRSLIFMHLPAYVSWLKLSSRESPMSTATSTREMEGDGTGGRGRSVNR